MDCFTEPIKGAASKLGELGMEAILQQFKYVIQHKTIIADMNGELDKLKALRQTWQEWEERESMRGCEIPANVKQWLSSVAAIENELQKLCEEEANKKKNKCLGSDLAVNYSLGKRGTKKTQEITSLKEEGNKLPRISNPKAPPPLGSTLAMTTDDIKSLTSRNKIVAEVIEKLKDDNFKRISICGMGGVGKTTLVKELIKATTSTTTQQNKGFLLFDKVVMAVVSQNPDYEDLRRQIADGLGLELKRQSTEGRSREMLERLVEMDDKGVKVLIVLDDVWKELRFELIGLPSRDHQKCSKILFTSRDEKVCQNMGSQQNFHVSVLLEDEAWLLFREMAGGDAVDKPDINVLARKVAKECAGLPLAIATIGRALWNKEKFIWENALEQLSNSQLSSFSEMQECVYSRIQLSIDILDSEELKYCLFLCGLFPEDFDIPVESMLRYGVGLGFFEATDAIWKARNQVHYLVNNLKRCFLLLDGEKAECVKIHDVVRDVVLKISSKEEHWILVQSGAEFKRLLKQKQGKWLRMSLILDDEKIIELEKGLECPTLELLHVRSQNKAEDLISLPENFISRMSKLKVLVMQNLCIPKASISSSVFHALINLHTLQLVSCDVGDISFIGKQLKKLEILSFAYSNIKQLPVEIGNLEFLRLLDLTGCDDLNFISTNVLARLSRLEELYFKIKNFPWLLNKDALKELENISQQLKVIEIKVRKLDNLPNGLNFRNLVKFWVYVVLCTPYEPRGYFESNIILLEGVDYSSIKSSLMTMQLVKKCEILMLKRVVNLKNVIYELDDSGLQYVKDLSLEYCPNLECVIDCSTSCCPLPLIKSLTLKCLQGLREILHASDHHEIKKSMIGFSYLEKLTLSSLPNLIGFSNVVYLNDLSQPIHHELSSATKVIDSANKKDGKILSRSHSEPGRHSPISVKLFSPNWMKQFPKLERLLLQKCSSLEMVFDLEGYSESSGHALDLLFPQLRYIEISRLENLLYVWGGNVQPCVQGFKNLRYLTISDCVSLRHVFTAVIASAIINLEELRVSCCASIKSLVAWRTDDEGERIEGHVKNIEFNKLYYLSLGKLPKLVSICSDSLELKCPSLRELEIINCPILEISLLSTHIHANTKDVGLHSFKENNSRSSISPRAGCIPFLAKINCQGNTSKINSKEVSPTPAQDPVPSNFEMNSRKGKGHMPTPEDLCVIKCDYPSTLETIKIVRCDIKNIVVRRGGEKDMANFFTRLKSLHLETLPNLVRFCFSRTNESWDKQEDMDECEGPHKRIRHQPFFIDEFLFPNLTYLFMKGCDRIKTLFSHSSLSSLEHLQNMKVLFCENMEEIVSQEETEIRANKIRFPRLQYLYLCGLPNLKAFCQGPYDLDFPSLQKVEIKDCPNMEVFSQGSSYTHMLEDVSIEIKSLSHNTNKKDINANIRGFKALVAFQGSENLSWTELCDKGMFEYIARESKMVIKSFDRLSMPIPLDEIQILQHVRKLVVSNCSSLVELFESTKEKEDARSTFPTHYYQLEEISLWNLPRLSHIWKHGNIKEVASFPKVTCIAISYCHNLRSLFSCSMAKCLVNLKVLAVTSCGMMEQIVTKKDGDAKDGSKIKMFFPKLEKLELSQLPQLECICLGDYDYNVCSVGEDTEVNNSNDNNNKVQILFSSLKLLLLSGLPKLVCFCSGAYDYDIMVTSSSTEKCPNIATFPHGNVIVSTPNLSALRWGNASVDTFGDLNLTIHYMHNSDKYKAELQKLETFRDIERDEHLAGYFKRERRLHITRCDKLSSIVPFNMMHLFPHMETLFVSNCESLKEIFESNDDHDYEVHVIQLVSLPNMKHIQKNHLQNLREISIGKCHDLKYVFPNVSTITSLPNLGLLRVHQCKKIEEIIKNPISVQQHHEAKIIFPSLVEIRLKELPSLQCFCRCSFPCYVEMPECSLTSIEDCPEMKTFWYNGTLYTPKLFGLYSTTPMVYMDQVDLNEDSNLPSGHFVFTTAEMEVGCLTERPT